jgi:hypothetical protein
MLSALALVAAISVPSCSWDNPGANRFQGDVPSAVQHYTDIPADIRDKLQKRMQKRQYDEVVDITRDGIQGRTEYQDLRDMHFGANKICSTVSRAKWSDIAKERGMVYCEGETCIIVPTVCGNVSRLTRIKTTPKVASSGGGASSSSEIASPPMALAVPSGGGTPSFVDLSSNGAVLIPANPVVPQPPIFFPPFDPFLPPLPPCCCIPVTLPPTPEPSTWLMMVLGLLGILWASRRRLITIR